MLSFLHSRLVCASPLFGKPMEAKKEKKEKKKNKKKKKVDTNKLCLES